MDYEDFDNLFQEEASTQSDIAQDKDLESDFFDWEDEQSGSAHFEDGLDQNEDGYFNWDEEDDNAPTNGTTASAMVGSDLMDVTAEAEENDEDDDFNFEDLRRDEVWNEFTIEEATSPRSKEDVVKLIEELFASLLDAVTKRNGFSVRLRRRRQNTTDGPRRAWNVVKFPGNSALQDWKFTCLIRVLELIHEALVAGAVTTKRDIYYKDVQLFKSQQVVDRIVEDLGCTFAVERSALNVAAAAKGLVCGNVLIHKRDRTVLDCSSEGEGTLVPPRADIDRVDVGDAKWVLVIEKEATFRSLAERSSWKFLGLGFGILVCGKGYPDVSTREFVHHISTSFPDIGIYGLVDLDPHGAEIYATYKFGSAALKHQSNNLAVPSLKHLGVKFKDLSLLCNDSDIKSAGQETMEGMLTMTKRDRRKALLLMQRIEDEDLRGELRLMLFTGKKAEIQILGSRLELYLDRKLMTLASS